MKRLINAYFRPAKLFREHTRLTKAEYAEALHHAKLGLDAFPHLPDYELERCEFCNRPDWEVAGECLARVRMAANKLGDLAIALDALDAGIARSPRGWDTDFTVAIHRAREILAGVAITADQRREFLQAQRAHWLAKARPARRTP